LFLIKRFFNGLLVISTFSPIALLWMTKAILIDSILSKLSFMKLAKVGEKIGLKHEKSKYIKEFGELIGDVKGHRVCVIPNNSMDSKITVDFKSRHEGLRISLEKPSVRRGKKVVNFKTSDWKFNRTFSTREARKDLADKLSQDEEFILKINDFYSKWIFKLDALVIGSTDVLCKLKYGFNFFPYIPASKLEELVESFVDIADHIDSVK